LKVKLIFPPSKIFREPMGHISASPTLPYGMGVITAVLRKNGYFVEQDDFALKTTLIKYKWQKYLDSIFRNSRIAYHGSEDGIKNSKLNQLVEELLKTIHFKGFDIIGFSIISYYQFLIALLLAEKLKQVTNSVIVFGGPFISYMGERYFQKYTFIDFMIVGDGGPPLLKLLDFLTGKEKCENIQSLMYRKNGHIQINKRTYCDINNIPLPDYRGLPLKQYIGKITSGSKDLFLPYQTSRGCLNRCSFCAMGDFDKYAVKSYDKIISELKKYSIYYKSNAFIFCDETLNSSYRHLDRLCDLFVKNRMNIKWKAGLSVRGMDEKLAVKMKVAGCIRASFGVESGSNKILRMMRKGFTVEDAAEVIKHMHGAGINISVNLMAGFLYENKSDIGRTIQFIKDNSDYIDNINWAQIFSLHYKSPIYNNPEEYGIDNIRPSRNIMYGNCFEYNETNGLKWKRIRVRQWHAYFRFKKAVNKYIQKNIKKMFLIGTLKEKKREVSQVINKNNISSNKKIKYTIGLCLQYFYVQFDYYIGIAWKRLYIVYFRSLISIKFLLRM